MQRKKIYRMLAVFVSATFLMTGCGNSAGNSSASSANSQSESTDNSSSSASSDKTSSTESSSDKDGTRTITDTKGNEVQLPEEVDKVATTIGAFAQITNLVGGADKLAASIPKLSDMYHTVWPNANQDNNDASNMESIIDSGAQVVYGPNIDDQQAKQLEDAGIAVVTVDSFSNADELKKSITLIADILGEDAPEKAKKFNDYYDDTINYVKDKTKDLKDDEKVKVLNLRYSGDNYTTVNAGDISSFYVECAGGIVSSADYTGTDQGTAMVVSTEQILEWNPDVIFTMGQSARDQIKKDPALASVSAVQNDKVYTEPSGTYPWSVRSAEGALMPLFLAEIMYPDTFQDLNLDDKIKEFYKEFYEYDLTEDQVKTIEAGEE